MTPELKAELKDVLKKFATMTTEKEKQEALNDLQRVGSKLDVKKLKAVIACGCGPSGERGVEDGLCST
ncbi:hypothetical protein [Burkholderia territorii]|uniref:Uncharacterized protein n=1 Tax=Burkholderia territorii TaxID=1503055 RepID=A0A6L3NLN7_9BURK|nr:hypothetical protein [Burkholderia territorii]KAB0685558.1 hypothetical protein F7R13_04105 [Burkholderia territorii]MBM2775477.1 hypothetical protein [Burkholderia territorii]VWB42985.1 hypothetical protein BTE28158_01930 [Burkholderia territorii]